MSGTSKEYLEQVYTARKKKALSIISSYNYK